MEYKEKLLCTHKQEHENGKSGFRIICSTAVTQEDAQGESTWSFSPGRKLKHRF